MLEILHHQRQGRHESRQLTIQQLLFSLHFYATSTLLISANDMINHQISSLRIWLAASSNSYNYYFTISICLRKAVMIDDEHIVGEQHEGQCFLIFVEIPTVAVFHGYFIEVLFKNYGQQNHLFQISAVVKYTRTDRSRMSYQKGYFMRACTIMLFMRALCENEPSQIRKY